MWDHEPGLLTGATLLSIGVGALYLYRISKPEPQRAGMSLAGRVCVVTGANTGIGYVVSRELAAMGARVILACRSQEKGTRACDNIHAQVSGANVEFMPLDLSSFKSVREFGKLFGAKGLNCHILINNAGVMMPREEICEGFERTLTVNHFGPFLLTRLMLPYMKDVGATENNTQIKPRIINVASKLEKSGIINTLDSGALHLETQLEGRHNIWQAYKTSKLCNVLITRELAKREKDITCVCVSPGVVNTDLGRWANPILRFFAQPILKLTMKTPEQGADTVIFAATDPSVDNMSGAFLSDRKLYEGSERSHETILQQKLWDMSEKVTD